MAKVIFSTGIELVLGALDTKHELISRQKHLHAPNLQALLDKEGRQKHYFRFDNFIRAMLYQELKS
jgi:hypothetical protein